ncbi:MAG TPA: Sir2 silent information regulator family NAD-dependent deacetylase [Candidatus Acutalibacter ornithocaccae]|uniref:Sir2 silent information regulator family NAD-dependent deacetylase n=1 Tax=Candidatus Acutalibacter ornithocaccae TaxID=2838416 RepID=A0A9D2RYM0_9FIRM|nr:Sir2 silent information regulator family NAD-dependent deacetylase [Candidatus Acutalibacter ornithocaccae]
MYSKTATGKSTKSSLAELRSALDQAEAVFVGAGAGLSASAGFAYSGPRFRRYFSDFEEKYGFHDMYTGGFTRFSSPEEQWAYWSRMIFLNRYCDPPKPVYQNLHKLVGDKDYFVLTTNVDHCFQKAGFDKARLFYTQGDYGLWQCSRPCHQKTYDNETAVRQMLEAQGFSIEKGGLGLLLGMSPKMTVPTELVPHCPKCGAPMSMNLRADHTFVEDEGWHAAAARYQDFVGRHQGSAILYLELGVGLNTPGIIKYNFWQQAYDNPKAVYACVNRGQAFAPRELKSRSICVDGDIHAVVEQLTKPAITGKNGWL